jgi:DtxR family Mn-dependent transcriptional regulator
MSSPVIEDALETALVLSSGERRPFRIADLAAALEPSLGPVDVITDRLVHEGYAIQVNDETLELTEKGQILGERINRRHKTLECFLAEMLGLDTEKASEEACRLEHDVTDETINRISGLIDGACPSCNHPGRFHRGRRRDLGMYGNILDCEEGEEVRVRMVRGLGWNRRLIDLGIVPGEILSIRRKLRNQSMVVQVKGCDVALSPEVARTIFVERLG